jgi:hypothetical protein
MVFGDVREVREVIGILASAMDVADFVLTDNVLGREKVNIKIHSQYV